MDTKVRNLGLEDFHKTGFEVGKCHFREGCQSTGLNPELQNFAKEIRLDTFEKTEFDTIDLELLKEKTS